MCYERQVTVDQFPYTDKSDRVRRAGASIVPRPRGYVRAEDVPRRHVRIDVPSKALPLPAIARATLLALGCYDAGRFEKVAWRIPFDFEDVPCALEDQKLGVNLHLWPSDHMDDQQAAGLADRVLSSLKKAIRVAETDIFYPAIKQKAREGKLLLSNKVGDLRGAYRYFRELASLKSAEHVSGGRDTSDDGTDFVKRFARDWSGEMQRIAERTYLANAMVVAYFSYLEHYLSLALPFSSADLEGFDAMRFLSSRWSEKFKTVVDISVPECKSAYDRLVHVAETHRNPRSHGALDKRGATLGVYLDDIGAVPLLLTGIEESPSFRIDPFDDETFSELTRTFDEVDDLLQGPLLGNASRWINNGFDVRLTEGEIRGYHLPPGEFEQFCEQRAREWEMEENMEW